MRITNRSLIVAAVVFLLMLVSYRYSLYQDVPQLSYLATPDTATPFQRLITYLFMIIGIIPTSIVMIGESFFCHTVNPAGTVLTVCNGQQFSLSDTNGFVVYIIASLLTLAAGWYAWEVFFPQKQRGLPDRSSRP